MVTIKNAKNHRHHQRKIFASKQNLRNWTQMRESHHGEVLDFFADKPNQLLLLNIEKEGWEDAIARFIKKPVLDNKFHKNVISSDKVTLETYAKIKNIVSETVKELGYQEDEILLKYKRDISMYTQHL